MIIIASPHPFPRDCFVQMSQRLGFPDRVGALGIAYFDRFLSALRAGIVTGFHAELFGPGTISAKVRVERSLKMEDLWSIHTYYHS